MRDSYRIFPVSLDDLCKVFDVEGKVSKYNPEFNNLNLLSSRQLLDEFKDYSIRDSKCLFNALFKAQEIYMNQHSVDITTIYSTSTLSLKIFRAKFLKVNIPVLKDNIDSFIRSGYYGGGTDYYKAYIKNAKYYDVNSLYSKAMSQPMPFEIIKYHNDLSNYNINDFFGFCLVEVSCPNSLWKPVLPYRHQGKTIYHSPNLVIGLAYILVKN
jgi:hypothetical protein